MQNFVKGIRMLTAEEFLPGMAINPMKKNIENTIRLKRLLLGAGFSVTTVESQYFDFIFCGTSEDKQRWTCHPPYKKQFVICYSFLVFDCQNSDRLRELLVGWASFLSKTILPIIMQ